MFNQSILRNRRRGSALLTVVIFGAIISVCAAYSYRSTMFQSRLAAHSEDYLVALNIAEAGAELAMLELNKDTAAFTGWTGSADKDYTTNITDHKNKVVGQASVRVTDVAGDARITATGYIPSRANPRSIRTVLLSTESDTVPPPWGEFGLFAYGNLKFSGGMEVKSFDPANPTVNTKKATVGSLGNISFYGSQTIWGNVQAGNNLYFDNNSIKVMGDAFYGNEFGIKNEWNQPQISGKKQKTSIRTPERRDFPVAPVKPASNNNSNIKIRPVGKGGGTTQDGLAAGASLSLSNSKVTFPAPGVYFLNSFSNNNNSQVEFVGTGDVKVFVTNQFDMSGLSQTEIKSGTGTGGPNVTIVANSWKSSTYGPTNILGTSQYNIFADTITVGNGHWIMMGDDAKLTMSGKNVIFDGGTGINMKEQWSTNPGKSSNVNIFATVAATFAAGAKVAGIFYGPDAKTTFSGGFDWWGAVIGKDIDVLGGPGVNIDQTLFNAGEGNGAYVTAWNEVAPVKL